MFFAYEEGEGKIPEKEVAIIIVVILSVVSTDRRPENRNHHFPNFLCVKASSCSSCVSHELLCVSRLIFAWASFLMLEIIFFDNRKVIFFLNNCCSCTRIVDRYLTRITIKRNRGRKKKSKQDVRPFFLRSHRSRLLFRRNSICGKKPKKHFLEPTSLTW